METRLFGITPARIRGRWARPGGYRQVMDVAFPLILSTGSISLLFFVDRVFLSWHSEISIAAAVPAGMLNFALISPFLGTAAYAGTLVAQYYGAGKLFRIGPAMWQGMYIALAGGLALPLIGLFANALFRLAGHEPAVQIEEVIYFRIINYAAISFLAGHTFAGFYSGRGRTWTIMWVNVTMTLINTGLDYVLIFGKLGLPAMGIKGAGIASLFASYSATAIYFFLITRKGNRVKYCTLSGWRFDPELFRRLIRYGVPSGIHFFLDIMGFTVFFLLAGRLGMVQLAASNMIMQVNMLSLLPMVGMGIATSILVGQFQGARNSALARRSARSALEMTLVYITVVAGLYLSVPQFFLAPFAIGSTADLSQVLALARVLMRFVACFSIFDALQIICAGALKGAGDTRFIMKVLAWSSVLMLIVPEYVMIEYLGANIYMVWAWATLYISGLGIAFFLRFSSKAWEGIRVIEK